MRVVCFDLGGVLVEINHRWKGALLDVGLPESLAVRFDVPLTDWEPFNRYQKGAITLEAYLLSLETYFEGEIAGRAAEVHNAILRQTYPGIPELIESVQQAGLKTGCLSNTNAPHWETMFHEPRLAVLRTLDFPIGSHEIGAEKPDPRMYEAFEKVSGAAGAQIAYFDDGAANVEAAHNRGWQAFVVDPNGNTASQIRSHLQAIGFLIG